MFPDHRQPRDRAVDGAAAAGAPSERQSRTALFASWVVIFIQFTLFLVIGICLFVLYPRTWAGRACGDRQLYPLFIWHICRREFPDWSSRRSWRRPCPT